MVEETDDEIRARLAPRWDARSSLFSNIIELARRYGMTELWAVMADGTLTVFVGEHDDYAGAVAMERELAPMFQVCECVSVFRESSFLGHWAGPMPAEGETIEQFRARVGVK
jgi:hypothetical protein